MIPRMSRVDDRQLEQSIWMAVHLLRGRNAVSDEKQKIIARAVVEHMKKCGYEVHQPRGALDFGWGEGRRRDLDG